MDATRACRDCGTDISDRHTNARRCRRCLPLGVPVHDGTVEEWRTVPGYEGFYEVSSHGRIRSLDRVVAHKYSQRVRLRGRVLKPTAMAPYGYLVVQLSRDAIETRAYVHHLVAEVFHGPRPAGMEVRHGPGGGQDNRAANLCYGTPSENQRDKTRDGTDPQRNKTMCPRGHNLVEPNLHAATARKGNRACLACNRAISYVRHARNRHGVELDLQLTADLYYEEILEGA